MKRLFLFLYNVILSTLPFINFIAFASKINDFPGIFSFGDSIFDSGNNHFIKNCTAQADFRPYGSSFFHHPTGRFTNGRTVVDFISQFMGIEMQKPYLELQIAVMNGSRKGYPSNGINFASAGSGIFLETNKDMRVIPIQSQLQQFKTLVDKKRIDPTLIQRSIFLLESGSNDVFNYFLPFNNLTLDPTAYVQSMLEEVSKFIDQLSKLGARRVAIFAVGQVGCVPARAILPNATIDQCYEKMNMMVRNYNKGLESLVKDIPIKYPSVVGVYGAIYDIVKLYRAFPARYGFSNVYVACCGNGTLGGQLQCGKEGYKMCSKPNDYFFWDNFHPSEHTYKLISKALWGGRAFHIRPINLKRLVTSP